MDVIECDYALALTSMERDAVAEVRAESRGTMGGEKGRRQVMHDPKMDTIFLLPWCVGSLIYAPNVFLVYIYMYSLI